MELGAASFLVLVVTEAASIMSILVDAGRLNLPRGTLRDCHAAAKRFKAGSMGRKNGEGCPLAEPSTTVKAAASAAVELFFAAEADASARDAREDDRGCTCIHLVKASSHILSSPTVR